MDAPKKTIHPLVRQLLKNRGITSDEDIETFLNPSYDTGLFDPFLLKDMDKAVDRILKAIKGEERIVIFTDYDTDGIPSGVIWHDFLKKIGYKNFINYIPHRHKEGYGLNCEAITKFSEEGATLMVTADCGITDNEQVEHAGKLGIDVIITDHHLPHETLPPAYAVINHKREDDTYPEDILCGCGVAFKLITALLMRGKEKGMFTDVGEGWEKWLLDMVAVSTVCDMVPLQGENRVLTYYGLKVLRKSSRPGLISLLRKARVAQMNIAEDDLGFVIGPRINAASRMDVPRRAFELLSTDDESEAVDIAGNLEKLNTRRKTLVASIVKKARAELEGRELREVIVIGNPDWQPGVLGLTANSLMNTYKRPVFMWGRGEEGETIKGSCRSDGSISVVECMTHAKDAFLGFGGHKVSGGFSVDHEKIHCLEDALVEAYKKTKKEKKDDDEEVATDGELSIDEVNWETFHLIDQLAPFGMGNPKPIFLFREVEIADVRWFGKEKNHLELVFLDSRGRRVLAIAFFAQEKQDYSMLSRGMKIDLKASLERNFFMGKREMRLKIVEVVRN